MARILKSMHCLAPSGEIFPSVVSTSSVITFNSESFTNVLNNEFIIFVYSVEFAVSPILLQSTSTGFIQYELVFPKKKKTCNFLGIYLPKRNFFIFF